MSPAGELRGEYCIGTTHKSTVKDDRPLGYTSLRTRLVHPRFYFISFLTYFNRFHLFRASWKIRNVLCNVNISE